MYIVILFCETVVLLILGGHILNITMGHGTGSYQSQHLHKFQWQHFSISLGMWLAARMTILSVLCNALQNEIDSSCLLWVKVAHEAHRKTSRALSRPLSKLTQL